MRRSGARRGTAACVFVLAGLLSIWMPCFGQTADGDGTQKNTSSELDLQSYQRELTRIEEASKNPKEIAELRRTLPDAWTVKDGERIYSVPTKEISEALRQIEHNSKNGAALQLDARLMEMRQHAEQLSRPISGTSETEAQGKLKEILKRGEFHEAAGPSAWDLARARVNRWIFEHIIRLLSLLHIGRKTGNAIAWGVLFLAVVLLFYLAYRWLTAASKETTFRAEVETVASDARRWVKEALAAADRGDFREAVHCAYWASVAHLEDIRILPRDRARTPRESLRLLEQYPKEQRVLQSITRSFELIWYGYRPVSAAEWTGTKEELEKMGCLQDSTAPTVPS